nr:MAG TPA: hypothetical protein [Caudoviricetes sp.]
MKNEPYNETYTNSERTRHAYHLLCSDLHPLRTPRCRDRL